MSIDDRAEPFRSSLDKAIQSYVKEHYPSGVVVVSLIFWKYIHILQECYFCGYNNRNCIIGLSLPFLNHLLAKWCVPFHCHYHLSSKCTFIPLVYTSISRLSKQKFDTTCLKLIVPKAERCYFNRSTLFSGPFIIAKIPVWGTGSLCTSAQNMSFIRIELVTFVDIYIINGGKQN